MPAPCEICTDVCKKSVTCLKCSIVVCTGCMRRIMLQSPAFTFLCAACGHDMSYEYIHPHFSKRFWKQEYMEYVCREIRRIEATRFPATMSFVAQKHRVRELQAQLSALQRQYAELSAQQAHLRAQMLELYREMKRDDAPAFPRYIRCGNAECRAYVSHNDPTCIVCHATTCVRCHGRCVDDGTPHQCDEAVAQSISVIQAECRECPSCHAHIHRIDGCDQMYCTVCRTPFSWTTGQIITGAFHNPHLPRTDEQGGECGGGRLPMRNEVVLLVESYCYPRMSRWLLDTYDMLVRFRRVDLHTLLNSRLDFHTHLQSRIDIIEHAHIEHARIESFESTCMKKWYKVEQKIRLNIALRDILTSYLHHMEGFFQQACVDREYASATTIHWLLVGPARSLTRRYIEFFTRTHERYSVRSHRIARQLAMHIQAFPYTGVASFDTEAVY